MFPTQIIGILNFVGLINLVLKKVTIITIKLNGKSKTEIKFLDFQKFGLFIY